MKLQLRQEVGFRCPVAGCGNPYLTWHHFDPPWRVEKHHRPEGMIALCLEHASKADNGAFTDDQLRRLKSQPLTEVPAEGSFDWLRQDILARVGGNYYYQQAVLIQIGNTPVVWFERDQQGNMLLNFRMPTISGSERVSITNNFWSVPSAVNELVCPPMGRLIEVKYSNGDRFKAEFMQIEDAGALRKRYSNSTFSWVSLVTFPVTLLELWQTAAGTSFSLGPDSSSLEGSFLKEGFISGNGIAGLGIGVSPNEEQFLFPSHQ